MDQKFSSLYRLGGLTSILSGFLMFASSICWFIFDLSSVTAASSEMSRLAIFHGIGVVTIILLVPTLLAAYGLLSSTGTSRTALGASFAIPWLILELVAHCSQTAPLNSLSELAGEAGTAAIGKAVYMLWAEWGEALFMTGAFLCMLVAICYGSALRSWGNAVGAYLFFGAAIAFPIGALLGLETQLHVLLRGIALLFLGGILIQAPDESDM